MVARPSRLRSSALHDAVLSVRPNINIIGAMTPPMPIASTSQGAAENSIDSQSHASAEIQQSREPEGLDVVEKKFGKRRRRSEQDGGGEGKRYAGK
jgi:hypothetical protein